MAGFGTDIIEQILLRLDVEDLLRCKSVCKSWLAFISHPRFIKTHLDYSYNADRVKFKYGHRSVAMGMMPSGLPFYKDHGPFCYVIGSSNGLVCNCYNNAEIVVANPCTRVARKLPNLVGYTTESYTYWPLCCGFGYDSSTDDYKVVAGMRKSLYVTLFFMLSLKSNVWEDIGEVKYMSARNIGVLCNGALHWVMFPDQYHNTYHGNDRCENIGNKAVILSFDLSKHSFKEIPQPDDDPQYQSLGIGVARMEICGLTSMSLGTMGDCLCIFPYTPVHNHNIWIMNKYNVKESWELGGPQDWELNLQPHLPLHVLIDLVDWYPSTRLFKHDVMAQWDRVVIATPVFVRSLVSPHAPFLNC